jgi:nucleoside-specific outer membrane channel protein Tsx
MENLMTIKALTAVAIVTAALSSPAFAQDVDQATPQKPAHALRHYRTTYNQVQAPEFVVPRVSGDTYLNNESFDRSRIGDHDPDFNPSGS